MLDVRKLTQKLGGNPDRWLDVKANLPLLTQPKYYSQLTYGYARGHEAYRYVENIRRYHQSLVGYLQSQEKKQKTLEIAKKSHVYVVLPNDKTQLSSYVMPAKLDITPQASANLGVFGPKESKNSPSHSLGKYILSKPTRSSAIHNEMALYNEPSGGD
ncbi:Membrane-bound lytic murein transglycosylase F precursor [Providencia alcalifaciens]|nr:Membrane-bound lytic murein transglycosylase F precursor [Providencia alcalifaciens]